MMIVNCCVWLSYMYVNMIDKHAEQLKVCKTTINNNNNDNNDNIRRRFDANIVKIKKKKNTTKNINKAREKGRDECVCLN